MWFVGVGEDGSDMGVWHKWSSTSTNIKTGAVGEEQIIYESLVV